MAIRNKFSSLRTLLTVVLLAMVLLPTLAIGWVAYSMMFETIRSGRIRDVGLVADSKHDQLVMMLTRSNITAEHFLSDLNVRCGVNATKLNRLCATGLIKSYLAAEGAIGATLHGSGGSLTIGVAANDNNVRFQPGQLAKFSGTGPDNNRSYFISITNESTGYQLEVTYPSLALESIFNPLPAELGLSGETFLVDSTGYFVTKHRYDATQGHKHPISARPMQSCLSKQSGEVLDLDYRDVKIIHGFRFIPEFGEACIMAHIDQDEAFAPLRLLQQRTFIAMFLFGVLLVIAVVYLARRIVKPVIKLTQVAHSIAEGNYQAQADVEGSNELAELAATFNYMTSRLHATQQQLMQNEAELKQLNLELERRVVERTRQLEAANEELESFNYSVAHDLRSPLRSIDGFSRVLSNKYHDQLDATGKDWLERVCRASQRMGCLIDDLLQLSQVARSTMMLEQVDLSKMAENVADDLRKINPERQVRFTLQQGLSVQADPGLLRAVMDNLLGNAYKFTGRKAVAEIEFGTCGIDQDDLSGVGRVSTRHDISMGGGVGLKPDLQSGIGEERVFFVRDNGEGFNMEYAHKLFGAFQRLHTIGEFEGTGIGLATVQRVIQRHNGRVWAEAAEGQGATFYFTLPQRERGKNEGHEGDK